MKNTHERLKEDLKAILNVENFDFKDEENQSIVDYYYDTSEYDIMHMGSCIRIRKINGKNELTVKQIFGEGHWKEKTINTSNSEILGYEKSNFSKIVRDFFPEIRRRNILKKLQVVNNRVAYKAQKNDELYSLSFDTYYYVNPISGHKSKELFEVELEAINDEARENLSKNKIELMDGAKEFKYSKENKYKPGVIIINQHETNEETVTSEKNKKILNNVTFGDNTQIIVGG